MATAEDSETGDASVYAQLDRAPQYVLVQDDLGRAVTETYLTDSDGDNSFDVTHVTQYEYEGSLMTAVRYTEDRGNDGVIDTRMASVYRYSDAGFLTETRSSVDEGANGVADRVYVWEIAYDGKGNQISSVSREDLNGDGVFEVIHETTSEFSESGLLTSAVATVDGNADGLVEYRVSYAYEYDDLGNTTSITTVIDSNGDGVIDESSVTDLTVYRTDPTPVEAPSGTADSSDEATDAGVPSRDDDPAVIVELPAADQGDTKTDLVVTPNVAKSNAVTDEFGRLLSETVDYDYDGNGVVDNRTVMENTYEEGVLKAYRYTEYLGADGPVSLISTWTQTTTDFGKEAVTRFETDTDGDGKMDVRSGDAQRFDAAGRLLAQEGWSDKNGDGLYDSSFSYGYTYSASGNYASITTAVDQDGDGDMDFVTAETFDFDAAGRIAGMVTAEDSDGDGTPNLIRATVYRFTESELFGSVTVSIDSDADGDTDSRTTETYAYDELGNLRNVTTEVDWDGDGTIDATNVSDFAAATNSDGPQEVDPLPPTDPTTPGGDPSKVLDPSVTRVFDDQGRVLREAIDYDFNGDGVIDQRSMVENTYEGSFLSKVRYSEDPGAVGSWRFNDTSYEWNANGQLLGLLTEVDSDGNGLVDARSTETYSYDATGQILTFAGTTDNNADGQIDSTYGYRYSYTAIGVLQSLASVFDWNGNGTPDYATLDEYGLDEAGMPRTLTSYVDNDGDGVYDQSMDFGGVEQGLGAGVAGIDLSMPAPPEALRAELNIESLTVNSDPGVVGDANGDRLFNSTDLLMLFQMGSYENEIQGDAHWASGDWNGDHEFDSSDLVMAVQHGHYGDHPADSAKLSKSQPSTVGEKTGGANADWAAAVDGFWGREDRD